MGAFSDFLDFLIEVRYKNEGDYALYKKIIENQEVDEELSAFIDNKINSLDKSVLKLFLMLKKYDILDKTKKNKYINEIEGEILSTFFDAYYEEEYVYSINVFLINFTPLRSKNFILDYYLENHEGIGAPFGLIDKDFIADAKFDRESLCKLIDLALRTTESINGRIDLVNMEKIFEVCEKMQIQDLKVNAAKKIVNYLLLSAREHQDIQRNFFVQYAFKYIDYYGDEKIQKRKELLNLILENTSNVKSNFELNAHYHEFEFDQNSYNGVLAHFREIGAHQACYEISQKLFNLYDYEAEKLLPLNIMFMLAATIAYDDSGLPIYTIDNSNFDDIFFHEKTRDLQLTAFLFTKYIGYIRENSNFEKYMDEFYLPESLSFIRGLGILKDFKECNFYGFISQMIPIIESHFRYCLSLVSEPYITPNGIGGYDYLPMRSFLESNIIREKLGINAIYVLKLIFDDRRGLNYRNKLAHGILNPSSVTEIEANLVFLTLISMSYFEQKIIGDK